MNKTGKQENHPELRRAGRIAVLVLAFVAAMLALTWAGEQKAEEALAVADPIASALEEPAAVSEPEEEQPLFTVCLDPGHGGNDGGSVSGDRKESDDVLALAKLVKNYLEAEQVQVVMTRSKDKYVSLEDRAKCANEAQADYFVSIHRNLNPLGCGVETWTRADYSESADRLAKAIQKRIVKVGVQQDRGVKHGTQESPTSSYYVLRKTKMPGVLIELGFIDNAKDNQLLDKYQKAYAKAIAKGILRAYALDQEEQQAKTEQNKT